MAWIKLSEELYLSDQSPYSLEKIDGIWYVVDNSTQKKSIPFTDIFNNPVFPIDYSNTDMIVRSLTSPGAIEGKHFRGESANTPGTPAFSFQGDINSGIYRIDADRVGFSAGGSRQGEFGVGYGGFTGNIIQVVNSTNTYNQTTSNSANWNTDILSGIGVVWEIPIIPKYVNSKIKIQLSLSGVITYPANSSYFGIAISRKIGAGAYSQIQIPLTDANGSYEFGIVASGASGISLYTNFNKLYVDSPNTIDLVTYKFSARTYLSSTLNCNIAATPSTGKSYCVVEEIQQ